MGRNLAAGFDLFAINRDNTDLRRVQPVHRRRHAARGLSDHRAAAPDASPTRCGRTASTTCRARRRSSFSRRSACAIPRPSARCILYDKRDNRQDPTSGYFYSLGTDVAGLGGDVDFFRVTVTGGVFYPFTPDYVLSFTGEEGHIVGIGQDVRIEDRYFVGGDNLRGFQTGRHRSARCHRPSDALGGETYYVGSLSLSYPMGLPQELGITGRVWTDFGSLFSLHPTGTDSRKFQSPARSRPASACRGSRRSDRSRSISGSRSCASPMTGRNWSMSVSARGSEMASACTARGGARGLVLVLAASALGAAGRGAAGPAGAGDRRRRHDADHARCQGGQGHAGAGPDGDGRLFEGGRQARGRSQDACATSSSASARCSRRTSSTTSRRNISSATPRSTATCRAKRQAMQQSYSEAMTKVENVALQIIADVAKERKANMVVAKAALLYLDGRDRRHRRSDAAPRREAADHGRERAQGRRPAASRRRTP